MSTWTDPEIPMSEKIEYPTVPSLEIWNGGLQGDAFWITHFNRALETARNGDLNKAFLDLDTFVSADPTARNDYHLALMIHITLLLQHHTATMLLMKMIRRMLRTSWREALIHDELIDAAEHVLKTSLDPSWRDEDNDNIEHRTDYWLVAVLTVTLLVLFFAVVWLYVEVIL